MCVTTDALRKLRFSANFSGHKRASGSRWLRARPDAGSCAVARRAATFWWRGVCAVCPTANSHCLRPTLSAIDWTMRPCVLLSLAMAVRAAGSRGPLNSGKIEHFVVLYMENRVRSCASAMCSLSVSGSGMCQWCVLTPRCLSCPPGVRPFLRMHGPARGR